MKKLLFFLLALPLVASFTACSDDDEETTWSKYAEWREANEAWLIEQAAREETPGKAYYERIVPAWNSGVYILMRRFSNHTENLSPISTSIVDVKYHGRTYDDVPFDSSYLRTEWGDSIFRTSVSNVVEGWRIALQYMHVGDSVEIVVPYNVGYNSTAYGDIKPYSNLIFGIKLVDIYSYDKK